MFRSWTTSFRMLALLFLLAFGVAPALASAQLTLDASPEASPDALPETGPAFVLRPADGEDGSYFDLEAEPGSTHELTVLIANADDDSLSLRTYAGDVYTLVNGGFGVRAENEPREDVSTWIGYDTRTYDLAPGEGVERSFTVTVPEDTAPGQYIAGIVVQTADAVEIEGSAMFDQVLQKSVAVFITVPGEVTPAIETGTPEILSSVTGQRIVVPVNNTGNVLLKPTGEMTLTDASGNEMLRQPFAMGSVYAGMETTLEIPLPPALPEGDYDVSVTFADPETGIEASSDATALTFTREAEEAAPLEVTSATVSPMPSGEDVQFAAVSVTVENRDVSISGVRMVLHVQRDGQPVEDFVLASSVTLQQGETVIEQRYIPLEGWSEGEWTFDLTLESTDPQTAAEATFLTVPIEDTVVVSSTD